MPHHASLDDLRPRLEQLDYGAHGLTRHEIRDQMPDLPDIVFLHLPDSKRLRDADEVLHEVRSAPGRAEGEFVAADDNTPVDGAEADYGPAAYGDSPLVSPTVVGDATNTPVPGFDGNSLETEREYGNE